jgi:ribosomal protein S18 acetylase RimI-like enzyme
MIECFTSSNIGEVKDLLTKTWVSTYSSIYDKKVIDYITENWHNIEFLKEESKNPDVIFYIYKKNNKILGLLSGYKDNLNKKFYLNRLYILPEYQGVGIGFELLNRLYDDLQYHFHSIYIDVETLNIKAIKFYEKNNFFKIKEFNDTIFGFETNITVMVRNF